MSWFKNSFGAIAGVFLASSILVVSCSESLRDTFSDEADPNADKTELFFKNLGKSAVDNTVAGVKGVIEAGSEAINEGLESTDSKGVQDGGLSMPDNNEECYTVHDFANKPECGFIEPN